MDFTRQSSLIPAEGAASTEVVIVGAGAIGSHTAEVLAKMGVRKIRVIDYDTVEPHNLPNQGFWMTDLGKAKVDAIKERIEIGTAAELGMGTDVTAENRKVEGAEKFEADIIISAVDSMAVRKTLFESFLMSPRAALFVDGRMGARFGKVYIVRKDPNEMASYAKTLHSDEEGYEAPCTEKATIFCAYGLSSIIGAQIAKHIIGEEIHHVCTDADFANLMMAGVS